MGSKNYVRDILNVNTRITNYPIIAAGHGYVDPVTKKIRVSNRLRRQNQKHSGMVDRNQRPEQLIHNFHR